MPHPRLQPAPLALAIALALSSLVLAPAQAQPVTAAVPIVLPAQPLGAALNELARQAKLQLMVHPDGIAGKQAPAVSGKLTPQQALDQLLRGSGLAAQVNGAEVIIRPAPAAGAAEASLGAVTVTANQLGEITEGTGSYTPGTIATATRMVLTPRETPQSISVVTRQQMDDFGLTSIDGVINHTPGVSVLTMDSERTMYYARGFEINNFQYDGIPMQRFSGYSSGNTLSDMAIYDRVEVLKGATGLLTGSGDPGATINLIRKKPTRKLQGHATLGLGSWDNYRSEFDVSGPINESGSVRGRAVAAYQDKHSHLDRYQRKTSVFYGVVEADLTPRTLLTVGADYQDNDPKGSTWFGTPIYNSNGDFNQTGRAFNPAARWSSWQQYTRTGFATLEHFFDNEWVAKLQLNHQINGYDLRMGSLGSGFPNPVTGAGSNLWLGSYVGETVSDAADFYASGPFQLFGRKHELVLGGSFSHTKWTNEGQWAGAASVADFYGWSGDYAQPNWSRTAGKPETTREQGVYVATRLNLRDDLKLLAGSRVANYKKEQLQKSGVVVPYLGLVYDLDPQWSLYGSYTSIFKPQSSQDELGRTLDPLEGNNAEIGAKSAFFDGRLNASLAYFHLNQDNYAVSTGKRTPSGTTAYRAVSGVRTKGVELQVSGALTPHWQVHAGITHQKSRRQGAPVSTLAPESQLSLYASHKLGGALAGLTLGAGARWQDDTWADVSHPSGTKMRHTVKSFWLLDASARYQFSKQLSASMAINNLLDKKYYTVFDSNYSWGEPRSFNVSLRYDF